MVEFCIGFFIGTIYTFIAILAGSRLTEDMYEEKKTSDKKKKHRKD